MILQQNRIEKEVSIFLVVLVLVILQMFAKDVMYELKRITEAPAAGTQNRAW